MSSPKIVLITGANRGIGKSILQECLKKGYRVIGVARSQEGLNEISQVIQEASGEGVPLLMDVSSGASIDTAFEQIGSFGLPDILINNAGIPCRSLAIKLADEEWDNILTTNLSSAFRLSKRCLKPMIKNKWGRIISIGSVLGHMGAVGRTAYSASKAGLVGFSKALAMEVARYGITVNVIAPGYVETDMTRGTEQKLREEFMAKIPMGKIAIPENIAKVVLFLASDDSYYITGETLHVNGGMYTA